MTDTGYDDKDRQLVRKNVARFADKEVAPHLDALNHYPAHELPDGILPGMRELGLFSLMETGKGGEASGDLRTLAVALEALARTAAAPAATLLAHSIARQLLLEAGAKAPGDLEEPLLAFPIYAEPGGVDGAMKCTSVDDALRLDGTSALVVNAPVADVIILSVAYEDSVALVAIEREDQGVHIGEPLLTLGMRGSPVADVSADGARVLGEGLIAAPPRAGEVLREVAQRFRGPAAAIAAGILASSIRNATDYAKDRYQGGCYIIDHKQVRAMLADMIADHAICREAMERLTGLDHTVSEPGAASLFVRAKERAAYATCDGVQLLGGYGYMEDYGQERCMRDAKQAQCLLGRCDALKQDLMSDWLAAETDL